MENKKTKSARVMRAKKVTQKKASGVVTPEISSDVIVWGPKNKQFIKKSESTDNDMDSNKPKESQFMQRFQDATTADDVNVIGAQYDPEYTVAIPNGSSIMPQTIETLVTGIAGFGWSLERIGDVNDDDPGVKEEYDKINLLLNSVHFDKSMTELNCRIVKDCYFTGHAVLEVIRNGRGEHVGFEHIIPQYFGLCVEDDTSQLVDRKIRYGNEIVVKPMRKRFRRYLYYHANQKVYFKEWLDPRPMNYSNGKYGESGKSFGKDSASELLYFHFYNPISEPYGTPPWIGQIELILGLQDADTVRSTYFRRKGVPFLIFMVSGGSFAQDTVKDVEAFIQSAINSDTTDSFYSTLILHTKPVGENDFLPEDAPKPPQIKVQPISNLLPQDAMFENYTKSNKDSIRESMRVDPMFLGSGNDVSKASGEVKKQIIEEWVLAPQRRVFSELLDTFLVQEHSMRFHRFRFNGPDLTNYTQITDAISKIPAAVTPNNLRKLASHILGIDLAPFDFDGADDPIVMIQNAAGMSALMRGDGVKDVDKDMADALVKCKTRDEFIDIVREKFGAGGTDGSTKTGIEGHSEDGKTTIIK